MKTLEPPTKHQDQTPNTTNEAQHINSTLRSTNTSIRHEEGQKRSIRGQQGKGGDWEAGEVLGGKLESGWNIASRGGQGRAPPRLPPQSPLQMSTQRFLSSLPHKHGLAFFPSVSVLTFLSVWASIYCFICLFSRFFTFLLSVWPWNSLGILIFFSYFLHLFICRIPHFHFIFLSSGSSFLNMIIFPSLFYACFSWFGLIILILN